MPENNITTEELAGMIQRGFDETGEDMKRLATKDDFVSLKIELKQDNANLRNEFKKEIQEKFDKMMTNEDKILKDLEILMTEKTVGYYQKKKERELWQMIIDALREHKILSPEQVEKINALEIF